MEREVHDNSEERCADLLKSARLDTSCTYFICVLTTILCLLATSSTNATSIQEIEPLALSEVDQVYLPTNHWAQITDLDGSINESNLTSVMAWELIEEERKNFGFTPDIHWLVIHLSNPLKTAQDWIIDLGNGSPDSVQFFIMQNGELIKKVISGDSFPFAQRDVDHYNFAISTELSAASKQYVFIRLHSTRGAVSAPVKILHEDVFWSQHTETLYLRGIYLGILFIMMVYNFCIFLSVKDSAYKFYVLYILGMMLIELRVSSIGFQYFWPQFPELRAVMLYPTVLLTVACGLSFVAKVLNVKDHDPKSFRLLRFSSLISVAMAVLVLALPISSQLIATLVLSIFLAAVGLTTSILLWRKNVPLINYILLAWVGIFTAFFILACRVFAILDTSLITEYALHIAVVLEILAFSLALAARINLEKRARLQYQDALLTTQKQINHELDKNVKERTKELEKALNIIKEISLTDELTQIGNRRYFENEYEREYQHAYRDQTHLCVMVIDIDHFKKLNDTYGHKAGDECLKAVAAALRDTIQRSTDVLARYGGEEFVAILSKETFDGAQQVATQLGNAIRGIAVNFDKHIIKMTISIGVALEVPSPTMTKQALFQKADDLLYKAKQNGRDQFVIADPNPNPLPLSNNQ